MTESKNVSWGKPGVDGAIFAAELGTKLPISAIDKLDEAFKSLGYVSEDGLSNADERESDNLKAWGGDTVLTLHTGREDSYTYTLIEATNPEVLKHVYGKENVEGTLEKGITIKANSKPMESHAIVIDMILKGGILKRIVIPNGTVTEIGEITYSDEDAIGYETTLSCQPDNTGNTHYEYIQKASLGETNA